MLYGIMTIFALFVFVPFTISMLVLEALERKKAKQKLIG